MDRTETIEHLAEILRASGRFDEAADVFSEVVAAAPLFNNSQPAAGRWRRHGGPTKSCALV